LLSAKISVQAVLNSHGDVLTFRRSLTGNLAKEWTEILSIIRNTSFTHEQNIIAWRLSSSHSFTVSSLYTFFLSFGGVKNNRHDHWWKLPIPPKIRAFMWLVAHKKILTKISLVKKGGLVLVLVLVISVS
jgi:hypothetical protein